MALIHLIGYLFTMSKIVPQIIFIYTQILDYLNNKFAVPVNFIIVQINV